MVAGLTGLAAVAEPGRSVEVGSPPAWDSGAPHFNGPKAFGATPRRAFTFAFPVRGERPLGFSAVEGSLPAGVTLDAKTGVLTGRADAGDYRFTVRATNAKGAADRPFLLSVGSDRRSLTPNLGWTTWNAYMSNIHAGQIRWVAKRMVSTGLAARGYAFVNLDAGWQGERTGPDKGIVPNKSFPDFPGLVREIHAMGLKVGVYSSPMMLTWCSDGINCFRGCTEWPIDARIPQAGTGFGVKHHEKADAAQWARWGVDYLKYDWNFPKDPAPSVNFARLMREALDATDRDIVLSLCVDCQVEAADDWKKYAQIVRGNGDMRDTWRYVTNIWTKADAWLGHIRPGFWYDLDMMAVGRMGGGRREYAACVPQPCRLTHDEQVFHFAYWAILPNPIHLSCDLLDLDEFTRALVSNEDLLEINQDYPAKAATVEDVKDGVRVVRRELSDGRVVHGFFNASDETRSVVRPLGGTFALRDALALRDLPADDRISASLAPHAARVFVQESRR